MRRALPALAAAALVLLVVLPALSAGRLVGAEMADGYGTQWFYWLAARNLAEGGSWGHTDAFFYPWGKDLLGHTGANFLDAVLAAPFRWVLGPVAGYNAAVLAMLGLNGLAFSRLAADLTDDRRAALLSSVLFALSPYALFELTEGRPTQALLAPLVLFVWMLRREGQRAAVIAGVFLAITGYQYWFYAFFGGMIALGHGLVAAVKAPGRLWDHVVVAGVALVLCAPVAMPLLSASAAGTTPGMLAVESWSMAGVFPVTTDGMSIGLRAWQPLHGVVGDFTVHPTTGERRFAPLAPLVPFSALLCGVAALVWPGKLSRWRWLAMVLIAAVLSVGPVVLVGESVRVSPLYLGLVKSASFLQRLWWPARAISALSVLLGMAVAVVLGRLAQQERLWIGGSVLAAVWAAELWAAGIAPLPTWDAAVPAGHQCLSSGPDGALIELPHAWGRAHLYYQTAHGRPIIGGMLENRDAFMPAESVALHQENTFLVAMRVTADLGTPWMPVTDTDRAALRALGYRYVILHRDAYAHWDTPADQEQQAAAGLAALLGAPVYEDTRTAIYAPWGDPSPCVDSPPTPDTTRVGHTEVEASWWGHPERALP